MKKKTLLLLLVMLLATTGTVSAKYRYHTKWIPTATNWASESWRYYDVNGNSGNDFQVYYETEDGDSQEYWGSNGEGNWQKARFQGNSYKMVRVLITGPGQRNGSKADQDTQCDNGTLYYSSNNVKSGDNAFNEPNRATDRKTKQLTTIEWVGSSTDFTIEKIDDNFRGEYFMIFYSKPFNSNNYTVNVSANYNPGGAAIPDIEIVDILTGETIPASDFDYEYVAPCDGKTAGTFPDGIRLTPRSEDMEGSLLATVVIEPADLSNVTVVKKNPDGQETTGIPYIYWTGGELDPMAQSTLPITLKAGDVTLTPGEDFDYYVTPTGTSTSPQTAVEVGRYTLVITGKGSYVGTLTQLFDIKKDMSKAESITGIHYDLPAQVTKGTGLTEFNLEVTDNDTHQTLNLDEDYTLNYYTDEGLTNATTLAAMTEGKYWVKITGKAPKYDENTYMKKAFFVVNEYQTIPATTTSPAIAVRVTDPGFPAATDSPTGEVVPGSILVSQQSDGKPAIATTSTQVEIPADATFTIGETALKFNVLGIANNALVGCNTLRWLDSMIPAETWTPTSLDRTVMDTPFYGIPLHTLVYLFGTNITGENYIYKVGSNDYRSSLYHIYEDVSGKQTKYSDEQ